MKKVLSLALVLVLVLGLASCGGAAEIKDPVALFTKASKDIGDTKSLESGLTATVAVKVPGQNIDETVAMDGTLQFLNLGEGKFQLAMPITAKVSGQEVKITIYINEDTAYIDMGGLGKMKMPLNTGELLPKDETVKKEDSKAPKFESAELTKLENKQKQAVLVMDQSQIDEALAAASSQSAEALASVGGGNLTVSDITFTILTDEKDVVVSYGISLKMAMVLMGETVNMDIDMALNDIVLGQLKEIVFPTDLDTYQEA